jgi:hypothetical protein
MAEINLNPMLVSAVEFACAAYNASLPPVVDPETGESTPATGMSPDEYMRFVGLRAVISYARQQAAAEYEAGDINKAERDARMAAIAAIESA